MCMKVREFYAFRAEDFKPIGRDQLREALDAGDLVYVVQGGGHRVVLIGEGEAVHPQLSEAA